MMVNALLDEHRTLDAERSNYLHEWQEIRRYVLYGADTFNTNYHAKRPNSPDVYDSTAADAHSRLVSSFQGYVTPPSMAWFDLRLSDPTVNITHAMKSWLQLVQRILLDTLAAGDFYQRSLEMYGDIVAYGTGVFYTEGEGSKRGVRYRSIPLRECFVARDAYGALNTLHRKFMMTSRQLMGRFPEFKDEKFLKTAAKYPHQKWEVIHVVTARENAKGKGRKRKPFASYYILVDGKKMIDEGGYDEMPYQTPRWEVVSGEEYGRSISQKALPDIRMANEIAKVNLKAAQKAIDPPFALPYDTFLSPDINLGPGGANWYDSTIANAGFVPLVSGASPQSGLAVLEWYTNKILRMYMSDLLQETKTAEMSATESHQNMEARMRQNAPEFGRLTNEFLNQLIVRSFNIQARQGNIPEPPEDMGKLEIVYESPLAQSQKAQKLGSIERMLQFLPALAQINPEVLDNIDPDDAAQEVAEYMGVPKKIMRDPKEIQQIREARQQQQQEQQQLQAAEQAGSAYESAAKGDAAMAQVAGQEAPPQ